MAPKVQIIDISKKKDRPSASFHPILHFIQKNQFLSVLGVLAVLFFSLGLIAIFRLSDQARNGYVQIISTDTEKSASESGIYVDLSGAVQKPGLYHLSSEARVNDLFLAAGGLSEEADREWFSRSINLAQKLTDGIKIYIPFQNEILNTKNQKLGESAGGSSLGLATGKININVATQVELESLPNVGPVMAGKIIDYRTKNGLFQTIEDLKKVAGIGEKTFEELKELITVY